MEDEDYGYIYDDDQTLSRGLDQTRGGRKAQSPGRGSHQDRMSRSEMARQLRGARALRLHRRLRGPEFGNGDQGLASRALVRPCQYGDLDRYALEAIPRVRESVEGLRVELLPPSGGEGARNLPAPLGESVLLFDEKPFRFPSLE